MGTNYIAPIWRMPRNANKDKLSNYSLYFDGSTHEINCGDGAEVDITGPISISVWFNANLVDNARGIVCKNNAAAQQTFAQYFFDLLSGEIRWRAGAATVTHPINAGQWYHAVGVYDGSNTTLYIDGTQVATAAASASSYQSNEPMFIGRRLNQSYFQGEISQVCIFDYALTDGTNGTTNQIEYLYNLNNPMAMPGGEPVAYWPLGDNSNLNSETGYPNISVSADSVFDFDSTSTPIEQLVLYPTTQRFEPQILTMSVWVNPSSIEAGGYVNHIAAHMNSSWKGWALYFKNNDLKFQIGDKDTTAVGGAGGNWSFSSSRVNNSLIPLNTWTHICCTWDGTDAKIFINGVCKKIATPPSQLTIDYGSVNDIFALGYRNDATSGNWGFDGKISNFQFWQVVLTDGDPAENEAATGQVAQIYNNGQPLIQGEQPQKENLVAWYKLNQSANWEARDADTWQIPNAISPYPQSFGGFTGGDTNPKKFIEVSKEAVNVTDAICVSAWVKTKKQQPAPLGTGQRQTIISNYESTDVAQNGCWTFQIGDGWSSGYTKIRFGVIPDSESSLVMVSQTSGQIITDNNWHHVVALWDGTTTANAIKIFVDGLLAGQGTSPAAAPIRTSVDSRPSIGKSSADSSGLYGNSEYFGGNADEFGFLSNIQVWDTALTYGVVSSIGDTAGGQIAELYNNGVPLETALAPNNLKSWYKLDNKANYIDYPQNLSFTPGYWSIDPNNITPGATEALNFSGGYQNLPGIYEGLDFNDTALTDNKFILSWWWNSTKPGGDSGYIYFDSAAGESSITHLSFYVYEQGGTAYMIIYMGDGGQNFGTNFWRGVIPSSQTGWSHMAVYMDQGSGTTWDASDTNNMKVFVNGSEISNSAGIGSITNATVRTVINQLMMTTGSNFEGYQWSNWSLLVGDNAVTSAIPTLYNGGTPGDISSLNPTWWYKLNSSDISFPTSTPPTTADNVFTVTDSSGNGNNTTGPFYYARSLTTPSQAPSIQKTNVVANQATSSVMEPQDLVNNNVATTNLASGGMDTTNLVIDNLTRKKPYSNYSFEFGAGINDYIQINNPGNIIGYGESAFTFSGWINAKVFSDQDGIFCRRASNSSRVAIKLSLTSPYNGIMLQAANGGTGSGYSSWDNILTEGQWYHICAIYDGTQSVDADRFKLWVNGVDQGARDVGSTDPIPTTLPNMVDAIEIEIGVDVHQTLPARCFDGRTSNFCMFDRVLNEQEILKIYNNGVTQDLQATSSFSNNILGWWPMDERSSYYDGNDWVVRDLQGGKDGNGINTGNVDDMVGNAPGSAANGMGSSLAITDLKNNMKDSTSNAHSINMGDYADGITNPANSGRSTDTP